MLTKTTDPDFAMDPETGTLINTNRLKLTHHKAQMERARKLKEWERRFDRMERELTDVMQRLVSLEGGRIA